MKLSRSIIRMSGLKTHYGRTAGWQLFLLLSQQNSKPLDSANICAMQRYDKVNRFPEQFLLLPESSAKGGQCLYCTTSVVLYFSNERELHVCSQAYIGRVKMLSDDRLPSDEFRNSQVINWERTTENNHQVHETRRNPDSNPEHRFEGQKHND